MCSRANLLSRAALVGAFAGALLALGYNAAADETSTGDKLRILYSSRFTFTSKGIPLVTIELASKRNHVQLSSKHGVVVLPDGEGGAEMRAGSTWRISVTNAKPAVIREWTIVGRFSGDDHVGATAAIKKWRELGYKPKQFEVGTVFGVEGEVIDSRELLIGVSPVRAPHGRRRARRIARKHNVKTSVHPELVKRPEGTIIASDGATTLRNPSVIWFAPQKRGGTLTLHDITVGGGGSQLHTSRTTRRYFGMIYVTVGRDGKLVAANAVPADRLLAGLVPSEIFPVAPYPALKAQAIAARTELLQKIGTRHHTDPYLLCSNQHCQVYSGAGKEHRRTTRAVRATRGKVLLRGTGGLVDARYSAACGGHSEHNEKIWGGTADPALRGRVDASRNSRAARRFAHGVTERNLDAFLALPGKQTFCGSTRYARNRYRWTKRVSGRILTQRVAARYRGIGVVQAIEPLARGVSGRITRARIRGSRRTIVVTGDVHMRRLFGGLRSTLFKVTAVGDPKRPRAFVFRGAGFGHGVGMCQIGAIGMANQGHSHSAILQHYYAGSRVRRLY